MISFKLMHPYNTLNVSIIVKIKKEKETNYYGTKCFFTKRDKNSFWFVDISKKNHRNIRKTKVKLELAYMKHTITRELIIIMELLFSFHGF